MASITRKPTSPFWIACFTDHVGKQRQRSTKETDKKAAIQRAQEYEEASRGRLNEMQARKVLSEIYKEVNGEPLKLDSIRRFLNGWLERKSGETKKGTFARYQGSVRKFLSFIGNRAERDLNFVHSRDVLAFRDDVAKRLTVSSANTDLKILRIAFGQAWKDGLIPVNPAAQIDVLKVKDNGGASRRPFTLPELKSLLTKADAEWRGIILAGLYTGQRLGDVVRLKWHQVDLVTKEIGFTTNKTGRRVLIPITKPLQVHLRTMPKSAGPDTPLFPAAFELVQRAGGDTRRLSGQFYELMVKADLAKKRGKTNTGKGHGARRKTNPLSYHSLRHTTTSLLKNAGVSEGIAMDIIGHDSREISLNYTHIGEDAKRAALEKLPNLNE